MEKQQRSPAFPFFFFSPSRPASAQPLTGPSRPRPPPGPLDHPGPCALTSPHGLTAHPATQQHLSAARLREAHPAFPPFSSPQRPSGPLSVSSPRSPPRAVDALLSPHARASSHACNSGRTAFSTVCMQPLLQTARMSCTHSRRESYGSRFPHDSAVPKRLPRICSSSPLAQSRAPQSAAPARPLRDCSSTPPRHLSVPSVVWRSPAVLPRSLPLRSGYRASSVSPWQVPASSPAYLEARASAARHG
jgi:hypothetical protein